MTFIKLLALGLVPGTTPRLAANCRRISSDRGRLRPGLYRNNLATLDRLVVNDLLLAHSSVSVEDNAQFLRQSAHGVLASSSAGW